MSNYALVDNEGKVVNVIVWDGVAGWSPDDGLMAVECEDKNCFVGGSYKDGIFYPPETPKKSKEELISQADNLKYSLINQASNKIEVLQDAIDLDMATEEERVKISKIRKYRVLLSRVDVSKAPDIEWPLEPA